MAETYRIRGHFSVRQTALEVFGSTERERERGRQREREREGDRERERERVLKLLSIHHIYRVRVCVDQLITHTQLKYLERKRESTRQIRSGYGAAASAYSIISNPSKRIRARYHQSYFWKSSKSSRCECFSNP